MGIKHRADSGFRKFSGSQQALSRWTSTQLRNALRFIPENVSFKRADPTRKWFIRLGNQKIVHCLSRKFPTDFTRTSTLLNFCLSKFNNRIDYENYGLIKNGLAKRKNYSD